MNDTLKKLAEDYGKACREVNQRLRRCEEFLQKGLRAEAIHYAQIEPAVLDVVASLDFPERSQWEEIALIYGLPAPPPLRLDTAEALNRAYGEDQPVEQHLKQHRLLALMRAPLLERLALMREIAQMDAGNPVWSDNIAEFENTRVQQIKREMDAAKAQNDSDIILHLWDELENSPWSVKSAARLMNTLKDDISRRMQVKQRQTLQEVAAGLTQAYAVLDAGNAGPLRETWNRLSMEVGLRQDDALWTTVKPALKWLTDLERRQMEEFDYQTALEKLEKAFIDNADNEELTELYYALHEYKRAIPPAIEERYHMRIENTKSAFRRRERIILTATIMGGIVVLAGFVIFILAK